MAYVPVAGPNGVVRVDESDLSEDELSLVGAHLNAIASFLANEPEAAQKVASFEGEVVAGVTGCSVALSAVNCRQSVHPIRLGDRGGEV